MKGIKVRELIKKLQKLEEKLGNVEVVIDFDSFQDQSHAYVILEKVQAIKFKGNSEDKKEVTDVYINLQTSRGLW